MRVLASIAAVAFSLGAVFELSWPPFYAFARAQPFAGERWYQPYNGYRGGGLLANFHAHAKAWGGLTFGELSRAELYALYAARGYDLIGISDYMSIAPKQREGALYVSAYEHGYGVGQRHQTVIGAERVAWFEYPIGASARHKQHVLDELRPSAELLVLNHLSKAGAYTLADLERLSGYDAIEVASKYGVSADYWDAALSAGRPVWGMASDDGHTQASRKSHLGIGALVIHSDERSPDAVVRALREGRFHALYLRENQAPIALARCEIENGELVVKVGERADAIRFFSAHGALRHEALAVDDARYRLRADDPYVRVEVEARGARMFLNPVIRWDGVSLPTPRAELLALPTYGVRALGLLALALAVRFSVRLARGARGRVRSRSRVRAPRPEPSPGSGRSTPRS